MVREQVDGAEGPGSRRESGSAGLGASSQLSISSPGTPGGTLSNPDRGQAIPSDRGARWGHPCQQGPSGLHLGRSHDQVPPSPLPVPQGPGGSPTPMPTPPYPMMSCRARSSGFSWYSMPCLAHRDLTRGAILCRLCRGMVGKRLGSARGRA